MTFARLRISTIPDLDSYGLALDGEVEDHQVELSEPIYDFGDLNDKYFPTLLAQNGARHLYDPLVKLGTYVDSEPDGQPDGDGLGDDGNGIDDEDGFSTLFMRAGELFVGSVTASVPGYLSGWIDFSGDLSLDPDEKVFDSKSLNAGSNAITWQVPVDAEAQAQGARFRFTTSEMELEITGMAPDGEVEDYVVSIQPPRLDFGDLPDPYPTLLVDDGARHPIDGITYLGNLIDYEDNGQPSATAIGDDVIDLADEDGVELISEPAWGADLGIDVTASTAGKLDAWADFDGNKSFLEPGEQIFTNRTLISGSNKLSFHIAELNSAELFVRYRFSTAGGLLPTGEAPNGEVEDYLITIDEGMDWGDMPNQYGTLNVNNGARHTIVPLCHLGDKIDAEGDGIPTAWADGDDHLAVNDEDGIVFLDMPWTAATSEQLSVSFEKSGCDPVYLWCWADFDGDGNFTGPGEDFVAAEALTSSPQLVAFDIPGGYTSGDVFVRCRMTGYNPASPIGYMNGGEVEDYLVSEGLLPVDIHSFGASVSGRDVTLSWRVEEGGNLEGFRVEHGTHTGTFSDIGYVASTSTETSSSGYSFTSRSLDYGQHRFRLVQVDRDGKRQTGPELEVRVELDDALVLESPYPNPFNPVAVVRFAVNTPEMVSLDLYSVDGRRVKQVYSGVPEAGVSHTVRIDGSGLPSGVYLIRLASDGRVVNRTVALVR